ncbi:MAG: CpaF family protein, partial [Pseudomonadota bacterium]
MFKDFVLRRPDHTKTDTTKAGPGATVSKPGNVVPYRKIDDGLRAYLDLKSRLHEELLGRLNLTVLDKVDRGELRREIGGLVHDFLAAESLPMRAD